MQIRQFPDCCGTMNLYDLDGWPEKSTFIKTLKARMTRAKLMDNRGFIIAIYASHQSRQIKAGLEEAGFECFLTKKNPRSPYILHHYIVDLNAKAALAFTGLNAAPVGEIDNYNVDDTEDF